MGPIQGELMRPISFKRHRFPMEGEVFVEETPGGGATFCVELPSANVNPS